MYYKEQIVNGVLCHQDVPNGEWIPFTLESLSISFVAMRRQIQERDEKIDALKSCITDIKKIMQEYS